MKRKKAAGYVNLELVEKLAEKECEPAEILYYLVLREMMEKGEEALTPDTVGSRIRRTRMMSWLYLETLETRGVLKRPEVEKGRSRRRNVLRDTVFNV